MNLAATREALDRFVAELPSGLVADRLQRTADATRALIDQALAQPGAPTTWADHNLAVVVADGLADEACRPAAITLFRGVRRRLADALDRDPDDLAPALALARGAAEATDDPRTAEDIAAVGRALTRPGAGPRLVSAAVALLAAGSVADDDAVKAAAAAAAGAVRQAAERTSTRLPAHPGAALDRIRLALLEATAAEGAARAEALSAVRGLLGDYQRRFGDTQAARDILSSVLALEARGGGAGEDVKRDALALLEREAAARTLTGKRAAKLVRAIRRAKQLDSEVAGHLSDLIAPLAEASDPRWFEVRELLYEATGEAAQLLNLWQDALDANRGDKRAARGLAERLMSNLRQGLAAPFDNAVLDRVLDALSPGAVSRWGGDDIGRLLDYVSDAFGLERALRFVRDTLLASRELRKKDFLWERALALATALDAHGDAAIDVARGAVKARGLAAARLALARALIARGEHLDEAAGALRPLLQSKGEHAAEAHALRQQIKDDPNFRKAQYDTLLAYERKLGVGTPKAHKLKVVFVASGYVLAELVELPAPDFYEHKHLRTMIRGDDLPAGVTPLDLERGDVLHAPIRGQDADGARDKSNLRVYWVADRSAVRLELDAAAIATRWAAAEAAFGIDSGEPVPLKVSWDKRKGRVVARLLKRKGGAEFRVRPVVNPERLPAELPPEKLGGRGKRLWGLVARTDDGTRPGQRSYAVVSDLTLDEPTQGPTAASDAGAGPAAIAPQDAAPSPGDSPDGPTEPAPTADEEATAASPRDGSPASAAEEGTPA